MGLNRPRGVRVFLGVRGSAWAVGMRGDARGNARECAGMRGSAWECVGNAQAMRGCALPAPAVSSGGIEDGGRRLWPASR
jgi:hypothetical protein